MLTGVFIAWGFLCLGMLVNTRRFFRLATRGTVEPSSRVLLGWRLLCMLNILGVVLWFLWRHLLSQ